MWNFKETPKKSNWFWKEKNVTVIKRQTEITTRCKSMLCFWKTILKKLSKSINYQKVRDHCYYNGKIKAREIPNGHIFLNSSSSWRTNSTWKVRGSYIESERRIYVGIMTSIRWGNFDVDSVFKIDKISMSSSRGFFYVVSTSNRRNFCTRCFHCIIS